MAGSSEAPAAEDTYTGARDVGASTAGGTGKQQAGGGAGGAPTDVAPTCRQRCTPLRIVSVCCILALFLTGTLSLSVPAVRHQVIRFFAWSQHHKTLAASIYTAIFTGGAIVCMPEIVLAASAGYMFGFPIAFACTYAGGVVAATLAFLISRTLLRNWVKTTLLESSSLLREMDRAMARRGLALALLIRLPYVPFVQMNYVFGVTPVTLKQYLIATVVGIIPGSALYAFIGTGIHNIESYINGDESVGPVPVILSVVGIATAIAVFVGVGLYARKAVKAAARELDPLLGDAGNVTKEEGNAGRLGRASTDLEAAPAAGSEAGLSSG